MKRSLKSLRAAIALLALAPLTAGALPRYCSEICGPIAGCDTLCVIEGRTIVTCGEYGFCGVFQAAPSEPQASAQQPAPAQADDAEAVCRAPDDQAQG
ncbi:hypothetical protein GTZ93_27720 [Corallococcus exiguus]|uniref:Uncharacterized protein n=2 Tax=Corallococcus exiguus TaxID=83462 RepID=A0A7X4YDT5_9BACT|nr:hypothetical protein [Corallococcus exiguus]NBC43598.1 hypothetical protein [Corallococcus exiguus]